MLLYHTSVLRVGNISHSLAAHARYLTHRRRDKMAKLLNFKQYFIKMRSLWSDWRYIITG